jgi:LAO/AO transport system kinase
MMNHATDPRVFIRSLANRGHLGGLTAGIRGTVRVMGLLGCRVVLLETVGVGQNEVEVSDVADIAIVLLAPGHGDSVQMIKAGLLETADIFAINKADRQGADHLAAELAATMKLTNAQRHGMAPDIYRIVATGGVGISELKRGIEKRVAQLQDFLCERRGRLMHEEVRQAILEAARRKVEDALARNGILQASIDRLLAGETSIHDLAGDVLNHAARLEEPKSHDS